MESSRVPINETFDEKQYSAFRMAILCKIAHPSGLEEKVEASLEGVQVGKGEHLQLDSEGEGLITRNGASRTNRHTLADLLYLRHELPARGSASS